VTITAVFKIQGQSCLLLRSEINTDRDNMAENEQPGGNNLDDFFAKKDKSKKKTKSSKFTVDDILQAKVENEEKSKKVRSSKKKEKDANRSDKMLGPKAEEVMFCFGTGVDIFTLRNLVMNGRITFIIIIISK